MNKKIIKATTIVCLSLAITGGTFNISNTLKRNNINISLARLDFVEFW
jgi:hypothetical protein